MTLICAVGPARVQALAGAAGADPDPAAVRAALRGGDDRLTLSAERPVTLVQAWRDALAPLSAAGADTTILLVHPSSWPARRIRLVAGVAAGLGGATVRTVSRSALLARPDAVIIEIDCREVLIAHVRAAGEVLPITLVPRCGHPGAVADAVGAAARACRADTVLLDAAAGVPGGEALAGLISGRLERDHRVQTVTEAVLAVAARKSVPPRPRQPASPPSVRAIRPAAAGAVLLVAVAVGVLGARALPRTGPDTEPDTGPVTTLVEGRVAVQIPADWSVQRVTAGPGSARVEITSPRNPNDVVHLTQARSGTDPASTTAALRRAVEAETGGVFDDFGTGIDRSGRPAITYRELRPGREIIWTVLADADLRIGIGCQGAPGARRVIDAVCRVALDSARRTG